MKFGPARLVLGVSCAVGSWAIALWLGLHSACRTYYATPDVGDFASFVLQRDMGRQGKITYLFGPTIFAFLLGVVALSLRGKWLENTRTFSMLQSRAVRLLLVGVCAWPFLLGTNINASHAMAAAQRSHWNSRPSPNGVIDAACVLFK